MNSVNYTFFWILEHFSAYAGHLLLLLDSSTGNSSFRRSEISFSCFQNLTPLFRHIRVTNLEMASEFNILIEDDDIIPDDDRNSNPTFRVASQHQYETKKGPKAKHYVRNILFAYRLEIVVFLLFVLLIVISAFTINQMSLYRKLDHKIGQMEKDLESTKPFIVDGRIDAETNFLQNMNKSDGQIACSEIFQSDNGDIFTSKIRVKLLTAHDFGE